MAKKVQGYIKLQIPAGKATPAPPVGPALGQHGVNIVEFTKQFNARTADQGDMVIPVVITVYADRSFSFITKTPPAPVLIEKACNIKDAGFKCGFFGSSYEYDCRYGKIHGCYSRRIKIEKRHGRRMTAAAGCPDSGRERTSPILPQEV